MVEISCHCGNISLKFKELPATVRDCDCPICNRLGALWGDFTAAEVEIETKAVPTITYRWGDGDYELHHCAQCGCSTHYTPTNQPDGGDVGINLRMLDRRLLEKIPVSPQS